MRICRFSTRLHASPAAPPGAPGVFWGLLEEGGVRVLEDSPFSASEWLSKAPSAAGPSYSLEHVRLLPPCWPSKIVCIGRNYVEHARELDNPLPAEPLIFLKPPSSMIATNDHIVYAEDSSRVDHEGEIALVIGRRCRHLGANEPAAPYIFGYTCLNDVTARDLQRKDGQWTRGKGFDTFCPLGPVISTDIDPAQLEVRTYLNGDLRQHGQVADMIFNFDVIVRFISRVMTLEPGDVIATGSPAGVGPMSVGDTVEVAIEGVGRLRNEIIQNSKSQIPK